MTDREQHTAALAAPWWRFWGLVALEIRGPSHLGGGTTWDVYVDGRALPGHIALVDDRYAVHLGGTRELPPPSPPSRKRRRP